MRAQPSHINIVIYTLELNNTHKKKNHNRTIEKCRSVVIVKKKMFSNILNLYDLQSWAANLKKCICLFF